MSHFAWGQSVPEDITRDVYVTPCALTVLEGRSVSVRLFRKPPSNADTAGDSSR